jgi:hypothetical protein
MYRIVDLSVLRLREEVCGAIEQEYAELAALLAGGQFASASSDVHEERSR